MGIKGTLVLATVATLLTVEAKPRFFLPETLYAAPGFECNVYFSNVFDSVVPQRYAYEALCEKGRHELKRWCWTPTAEDAGTVQRLVLRALDDDGIVAAATTTVRVAAAPDRAKPVAMATLAASLTNCRYPQNVFSNLQSVGCANFRAVGSRGGHGVRKVTGNMPAHDGYGGWTFVDFLERYRMSLDEVSSVQSKAEREQLEKFGVKLPAGQEWRRSLMKSPFIRIENGKKVLDVQMWLDKVNGGRPPELVLIELGVNGTFGVRDDTKLHEIVDGQQIPNARKLVKLVRAACPTALIAVCTEPIGCGQDAYAENYGCLQSEAQFRRVDFYINRALAKFVAEAGDTRMRLLPFAQAIDPEGGYIRRGKPIHARSKQTAVRDANALHPGQEGGWQLADAVTAFVLNHWTEL